MVFRIHFIHPIHGDDGPAEDGITHRPRSWPSREAAQAQVDAWKQVHAWNSSRDDWEYDYAIIEFHRKEQTDE